ncbi:hypothetical protein CHARACLAT_016012 [Characodon lateralis]|uniref:Uncharacterized protein n=1 Tax=Characodon lateralis TaxID=208331 RepID=A0ABU7E0W9_9TELE|nr:hypothetical protein [Characodon lateralis]
MEGEAEVPVIASREALNSPSSESPEAPTEPGQIMLTPNPRRCCRCFCQPWCLFIALILLLLFLLGSWAVVHLTLGTNGGSPFRISASYDQRIPHDDTATVEPHFTTNCTMGPSTGGTAAHANPAMIEQHLIVLSSGFTVFSCQAAHKPCRA